MTTMMIDWIDFGQVSAERDNNLTRYFFENGVLQSAIDNRNQFLILGRKGAGKTAVFQHMRDNSGRYIKSGDISINMSLQNYSWDVHKLLATDGKAPSLAYIQSWKYIIYLLAIRSLNEKSINSKKLKSATKLIEKLYSSPSPSLMEVVGQKLLQLSTLKLPRGGVSLEDNSLDELSIEGGEISFSDVQNDSSLQVQLNHSIERLTDILEDALSSALSDETRIFVSFDRIDEAWDASSYDASQKIITGLIGASEFITSKFRGLLRPIIFLREDIFDTLDLNDKNKLRADCGQLLAWKAETISKLIMLRVNHYARESVNPEILRIEDLFDRDQMRQQRPPFDYIMLRTMLRPRDFIRMFQLVKQNMLESRDNAFGQKQINPDKLECQAIYNCEPAYSEWLIEELKDEWRVQYPFIKSLLDAIQNIGLTTFSSDDLIESVKSVAGHQTPISANSWLKFLYDNSIIGFRVGRSNQWKFKCFANSQGFVESSIYKVHDGLHKGLNLKERRRTSQKLA